MKIVEMDGAGPRGRARLRIERPLVSVWVGASLLNRSEHHVAALIEDGSLPFSFNIARPGVGRACVRISMSAIMGYLSGGTVFAGLAEFFEAVFPEKAATYRPVKLAWMMQCDSDHIYKLIRTGALEDVGSRSYEVSRESLLGFLTARSLS